MEFRERVSSCRRSHTGLRNRRGGREIFCWRGFKLYAEWSRALSDQLRPHRGTGSGLKPLAHARDESSHIGDRKTEPAQIPFPPDSRDRARIAGRDELGAVAASVRFPRQVPVHADSITPGRLPGKAGRPSTSRAETTMPARETNGRNLSALRRIYRAEAEVDDIDALLDAPLDCAAQNLRAGRTSDRKTRTAKYSASGAFSWMAAMTAVPCLIRSVNGSSIPPPAIVTPPATRPMGGCAVCTPLSITATRTPRPVMPAPAPSRFCHRGGLLPGPRSPPMPAGV